MTRIISILGRLVFGVPRVVPELRCGLVVGVSFRFSLDTHRTGHLTTTTTNRTGHLTTKSQATRHVIRVRKFIQASYCRWTLTKSCGFPRITFFPMTFGIFDFKIACIG
jgi:hypothetical protein